jgi:hypothetical protein
MTMKDRNAPTLGPSDSSDSGADLMGSPTTGEAPPDLPTDLMNTHGVPNIDATTDRSGTGERMSAGTEEVEEAADIGFDRIVGAEEAGLGGGLDQAEEALLGITDEELARSDPYRVG